MLRPRIIPCLLVHNKGLVKTTQFTDPKYVGDPLNAVRIFNEKEVDELIVVDIDASVNGCEPNYDMIANLAAECRMPLCYGGGIKTVEQADRILQSGVEKVSLSSALFEQPNLANEIAAGAGLQSVAAVLDIKKRRFGRGYDIYTHNGRVRQKTSVRDFVDQIGRELKVGELIVNSIDQDGVMKGYDLELIRQIKPLVHVPMTVLGGAGCVNDLSALIDECGLVGAAAGSMFVFNGKYRAVLISYPSGAEKAQLIKT